MPTVAIGPRLRAGSKTHRLYLQRPGPPVPDGDGGFTESWIDLEPPTMMAWVEPGTATKLERAGTGTTIASATHILHVDFHPDITTKVRAVVEGRVLNISGVRDLDERHVELELVCEEVVR